MLGYCPQRSAAMAEQHPNLKGMPFYTVIYGSEGKHCVVAKPRMPRLGKKVSL
jgi:hypothetical protein